MHGLYKSTATNTGEPTYYYRGNVENNYVSFAGFTWRIIRVNEDGTIRMIMQNVITEDEKYVFNSSYMNNYIYMYYTNSTVKNVLEEWYNTNLSNYLTKMATGDYFCEQAKVKLNSKFTSGDATMSLYTDYTPNFKCEEDGNGKGIVNGSIGLITYDEVLYAGGYYDQNNDDYYLYNSSFVPTTGAGISWWTMSPGGYYTDKLARAWYIDYGSSAYLGRISSDYVGNTRYIRPVINLNTDVTATGLGTSEKPYTIQ